ncbi:MAG: PilZ domain-containing protein [Planctomycetota bacterium]
MRYWCMLEAVVRGRGGAFVAETVNVSRSGVLVRLQDARAAEPKNCFRTGADVSFVEAEVKVRADLARVADGDRGELLLAFRFRANLDPWRCRSIGIEDKDDGVPTF